jgi:biotin transport system substrate-specific component
MKTRDLVFTAFFVALATAGAFLKLPLPFMSVTFQLFFAILAGIILGPVRGLIAMAAYMLIGLAGIPVFTLGGGPAYILQPSFGFILGFLPAAYFSGLVYEKTCHAQKYASYPAYIAGMLSAYIIGIPYLFIILKFYLQNPDTTFISVVMSMLVFVAKDTVLGLILFLISGRIPVLKRFAES